MLNIWGVEVTQATQFFRSTAPLCGPTGLKVPCADNTVPLVAEKPLVFRLYLNGTTAGNLVGGVVTVPDVGPYGPQFRIVGTGAMLATGAPAARLDSSTTLQVRLPPQASGTWRFDIVAVEYAPNNGPVVGTATASITLSFTLRRRIRVRLVRIHYTGRNMDVAAPTVQSFWEETDFAQRVLPIPSPGFEIVRESVELYDGDFTRIDPTAGDTTWAGYAANNGTTGSIPGILNTLVAAESLPADVVYVASYVNGTQQSAFSGWAVGRWIISSQDGPTLAHEVLHHWGVPQHAPCGGPQNIDPAYPNYPAFSALPAASIGEVGFDWVTLAAYDPMTTLDLMSYCAPKWISPYNYVRCYERLVPPAPPAAPPEPPFRLPDRIVDLNFARFPDRWAIVDLPGFARPLPPRPPPPRTELEVVVRDRDGSELFRGPAPIAPQDAAEHDSVDYIRTDVPWFADATVIELCRGSEVLTRVPLLSAPELKVAFPLAKDLERGHGLLTYGVRGSGGPVSVAIRVSHDGGDTWTAIVSREPKGKMDVGSLLDPAGGECLLEVLATSGYHTATKRSKPFRLAPREQSILAWSSVGPEGGHVRSGVPVHLFAVAPLRETTASQLSWFSDLDGEIGRGTHLITTLTTGRHVIEVRSPTPFELPSCLEIEVGPGLEVDAQ